MRVSSFICRKDSVSIVMNDERCFGLSPSKYVLGKEV